LLGASSSSYYKMSSYWESLLYISRLQAPWLMADAHEFSGTRRPTNPSSTCSNGAPVSGKQHMYRHMSRPF